MCAGLGPLVSDGSLQQQIKKRDALYTLQKQEKLLKYARSGPLAQLVERFHGMEEVRSSSLLRSTTTTPLRSLRVGFVAGHPIETSV